MTKTDLAKGFDSGNYDNAYVSQDLSEALETRNLLERTDAYRAGYFLGFFSSYELHEIGKARAFYEEALEEYGAEARALGLIDEEGQYP